MIKVLFISVGFAFIGYFTYTSSPISPFLSSHRQRQAEIFTTLSKNAPSLNKHILKMALTAYDKAAHKGKVKKPYLTVINYHLPSNKARLWVFNVNKERLLFHTYVAHGKNSGQLYSKHFSNSNNSKATSLGTYLTKNTYYGNKGLSLTLSGLEKGVNDQARHRHIVIHGAWYVNKPFIKRAGQAGRSWGCPAVSERIAKPLINAIKGGSVLFSYYPSHDWLSHSKFI